MSRQPIRNSAKAVIVQDGRLLVIAKQDAAGMYYILPGGGQQPGETLQEALRRECQEEISVRVEVGDLLLVREYIGSHHEFAAHDADVHQVEFMFQCEIPEQDVPKNGVLPDTDQVSVEWLPIADLERYRLYPSALRPLIKGGKTGQTSVYMGDVN